MGMDPRTFDAHKLEELMELGVDSLSLGVQDRRRLKRNC